MAPHALNAEDSASNASVASGSGIENPFGFIADPHALKGTSYASGADIVAQSIYTVLSKIFSYETPGTPGLLDLSLQEWSQHYGRKNAFGNVPYFHRLQVRAGASSAILGYFGKNGTRGKPLSVAAGANALVYMQPVLKSLDSVEKAELPLALNVSAIDFDETSASLVSNYGSVLSVARALEYPVLSTLDASNGLEIQHFAVLNQYLAALTGKPSINVFDGPEFAKTFTKYKNLLSVEALGSLYQELLASSTEQPSGQEQAVEFALANLNKIAGTSYSQFEYVGHATPETTFVTFGTTESSQVASIVRKLSSSGAKIGVVQIRSPLPFNTAKFVGAIPTSVRKVVVLGQESSSKTSSILKADVTAALFLGNRYKDVVVNDFATPVNFNWTPVTVVKILAEFTSNLDPIPALTSIASPITSVTANSSPSGKFLFWGKDNGALVGNAHKLALSLSLDSSKNVAVRTKYDNSKAGGLFQTQISASEGSVIEPVDAANVVVIEDQLVLANFDVFATILPGASVILINSKPIPNSVQEDVIDKLPVDFKRNLASNRNQLFVLDFSLVEDLDKLDDSTKGLTGDFLIQTAFWNVAAPELGGFVVNKLLQANGNGFELLGAVLDKFINNVQEKQALKKIDVSPEWINLEDPVPESKEGEQKSGEAEEEQEGEEEVKELPFFVSETSFFPNPRTIVEENEDANHHGFFNLAKKVVFSEAYSTKQELRPDLPVKNFVVKVQENKRLTPNEYNRNIFHIEFDVTGTGLTYDIGEALGIHGRNNSEEVEKFLEFYNVDGDSLIEVANKEDSTILETRSARHILAEGIDFLGKPPKRFYESLAPFATNEKEKSSLENLAGPSGAEELKKRQDVDFSTYVDILEEFPSARPSFAELVKIIAPLKRREYSIASSQRMHPNAVHLLIVVVDWVDPKGRTRYGHCSKYLSDLKIGDELVVSVKPSVMKLPPLSTQPIIMSGLGTGLAPFKAFIEEKIWQQSQGMEIGEIYLFMGSRHKKEEYLYGEIWEAYKSAGILTHIGAAFSRDQPQKIYIQDKIRDLIDELTDAFVAKEGSFYLCGPTWPVPDITACLEDIVLNGSKKAGIEIKDVAKEVEEMKENGRYILEVY